MLLGMVCALLAWLLSQTLVLKGLDRWLFDGCFQGRGTRASASRHRILLIGLDDRSLDEFKKPLVCFSPELAEAVDFLHGQDVAAIGLDLLIPESLRDFPEFQENATGDAALLGRSIQRAGNGVLPARRKESGWLLPLPQWRFKSFVDPEVADLGFVNLSADEDKFIRRQQLTAGPDGPSFPLALLMQAHPDKVQFSADQLSINGRAVPLSADESLTINYVGPPHSFEMLPFREVLRMARGEAAARDDLAGAICILGSASQSQQDLHPTPYSNNYVGQLWSGGDAGLMFGSEIHANVLATLMDEAYVRAPSWPAWLACLLAMGAALGACLSRLNLELGAVLTIAHHFACRGMALAAFSLGHWRLEILSMLLLGAMIYSLTFALRWRRIRRMLGMVKSEAVARLLESDPGQLNASGEEREITVLFSDIRDFTTFSEKHTPQQVVSLLNAYFTAIVPLIEQHGGTLNQYMGDGIMVIFGAPVPQPDHPQRAVRAGIDIVERVHSLRDTWLRHDCPGLRIGVGIHTGKVLVGAVGSPSRLDYTAIGDTVNSAARIEAENKRLGTVILISDATYRALPAKSRDFLCCLEEPLPAQVKGRREALLLHQVVSPSVAKQSHTADPMPAQLDTP
jgi:adenylate cyclase